MLKLIKKVAPANFMLQMIWENIQKLQIFWPEVASNKETRSATCWKALTD